MPSKNARLQQWINYRIRVCLQDSRMLVGSLLAFDRHMNIVLADAEEFRKLKIRHKLADGKHQTEEKEVKRSVGLMMIRGENILTLTAEAPPPAKPKTVSGPVAPNAIPGRGVPAGRGAALAPVAPVAPVGLAGPVRGVGGPAPQLVAAPLGRGVLPGMSLARPPLMPPQ
ncbi:LSM domain-containing protein [Toxoplasma gondii ME49]|uniref:Sm protein B n=17 Tax=Toxoplasma gondii TaxID=5811 RepID=A0A125YHJ8_TOXGV|nr:LSM domain-containing protein [Toxoplasma gondii ME49]EPR56961.1 LSM domain-containing protein [Toxoplasma gondii GT1]ESS28434.1 LSM domain-containing protein [Toxoplasma gondii VEG]KAF4638101.1 LSM domain-containing protein [Toxoplasma gondii]KFG56995.1 LSM domain-containing protein [Toxoplasma gondii RUB]KFG99651.1 LSM domain-containing protein [Toxoplasma gondii VAND]KYF39635.1 LSM domain-containing protein [Toxoplasma gondii ARI]|eukprot:XP_018635192.1 LSM domain-containing protein [Toxoplasma gondii ME49]